MKSSYSVTLAGLVAIAALLLGPGVAHAQFETIRSAVDANEQADQQNVPLPPSTQPRTQVHDGRGQPGKPPEKTQAPAADEPPEPFGANLFAGGFHGEREDELNPGYVIMPGDRITLRIWGATSYDTVAVVDAQGNIFVPDIGPIKVAGVKNKDLNARIVSAVRTVFTQNVDVYTNLEGTSPVLVFVTGFVHQPGSYAGVSADSILFYLGRAGGIDSQRGSYRKVFVKRAGEVMAQVDLYRFIIDGELPRIAFQDGDTIVVAPRGDTVRVVGAVRNANSFELTESDVSGLELMEFTRPEASASHATVEGTRGEQPYRLYLSLSEFASYVLRDGDGVSFVADRRDDTILVDIEGSHLGPSRYAVPDGTTLLQLLDHVAVELDKADIESISLRRISIAERQKIAIEDSLRRLETTVLSASSQTDEEARIRAQEARLISDFVARAREVEPEGVLVVAQNGKITDLRLESGDIVSIPERSRVVMMDGEVMVPQAIVYIEGQTFEQYIKRVGGFTARADQDRYLVKRRNGEVVQGGDAYDQPNVEIREGDEIVVLPAVPVKNLQLVATISRIVFQLALSVATVFAL